MLVCMVFWEGLILHTMHTVAYMDGSKTRGPSTKTNVTTTTAVACDPEGGRGGNAHMLGMGHGWEGVGCKTTGEAHLVHHIRL